MEIRLVIPLSWIICQMIHNSLCCQEGFPSLEDDEVVEIHQIPAGLYVFPKLRFKCNASITRWTYRLADNEMPKSYKEIELWSSKDGEVYKRRLKLRMSSRKHSMLSGLVTYTLPHPLNVNTNDVLALQVKHPTNLVYTKPSEEFDAYFLQHYPNSFHIYEAKKVTILPLIAPTLSGENITPGNSWKEHASRTLSTFIKKISTRQATTEQGSGSLPSTNDSMLDDATSEAELTEITTPDGGGFVIIVVGSISGGLLFFMILFTVVCCCVRKFVTCTSQNTSSDDYHLIRTTALPENGMQSNATSTDTTTPNRIVTSQMTTPLPPVIPRPKTLPKPKAKKMPLLPGRNVQSLERMLDNTEHLHANERSVGVRSISSPAEITVQGKGATNSLPQADTIVENSNEEGVPREMSINSEDEDYTNPGDALEISMTDNVAYKKSTLRIERTEASKTGDSAQELETEAEQEAQNTPPIHSYDEPHVFW